MFNNSTSAAERLGLSECTHAPKEPGICEIANDTLVEMLMTEKYLREIMHLLGIPETNDDGSESAPRDLKENLYMVRDAARNIKTCVERIKAFL